MRIESYCLHVGRRAPQRADGHAYLAAPLKGRLAPVIGVLVNGRRVHPEIPQQDVSLLIWGLLVNTKVTDLARGPKRAALTLLDCQTARRARGDPGRRRADRGCVRDRARQTAAPTLPATDTHRKHRAIDVAVCRRILRRCRATRGTGPGSRGTPPARSLAGVADAPPRRIRPFVPMDIRK